MVVEQFTLFFFKTSSQGKESVDTPEVSKHLEQLS